MDVVGLAFTLFGHLLASVLYIWRRIPFSSSSEAVDRSSILENKDQLRQLWEGRIMADEQSQVMHESSAPNTGTGETTEKLESKKPLIVENGSSTVGCHSEGPDKGDSETRDSGETTRTSTDHNHTDPVSISEVKESLTNGNEPLIETNQADQVDLPKSEISAGQPEQESVNKEEEKMVEKAQNMPRDNLTAEEGNNGCPSDAQKADKDNDDHHDENEVTCHAQDDINKDDKLIDKEKEVGDVEKKIGSEGLPDRAFDAVQVADQTEERDEPDTETYYTSNFTFVCQKSHEEDEQEIEEQQFSDEPDGLPEKKDISDNITTESAEVSEKEMVEPSETRACDDSSNADTVSKSGTSEVLESQFSDSPRPVCTESPENAVEAETEATCSNQPSCEHAMTSDLQEANDDEAETVPHGELTNEKSENESEIDNHASNELNNNNNATEGGEVKELPIRAENATPDSDGELLRTEKIERPSHFVRLKRTGVQKTERPYDSGTTESKIAMEIREMREREEELRLMRERMQSPDGSITSVSPSSSPMLSPSSPSKTPQGNSGETGPGYRVSTVFGHKGSPVQSPMEEEKKIYRTFSKESAVEKEIRLAKNREEELRKEKGLPPREDDSYIKPSQVKSSQVRVFGKMNASNTSKELATTKIQQEIEEQTLREMALREKGHIQTISQERTDSKVAKLKDLDVSVPECPSPASPNGHGPFSDRSSKRSTPSPTGSSHGSYPPVSSPRPVVNQQGKGISMQKFIASKGKETTFIASRNGPSHPEPNADASRSNPVMRKAKRTVSVESKIQQEILEMKLREEELRRMHNSSTDQSFLTSGENGTDLEETKNDVLDYVNGQEVNGSDDLGPSSNNLIAQWEQRIQKAEGKA